MKTAVLPSLRVAPELRAAAEAALQPGETLSAFVEQAVRQSIALRNSQAEFLARGLASAERARETGEYVDADAVLARLASRLEAARKQK